jgi:hypothetical protein
MVSVLSHDPSTHMNADHAQTLADRLHDGQLDRDGAPMIDHIRRVAAAVPRNARAVAWLHETLEHTSISEQALLAEGLSREQLRAIRLLTRVTDSPSDTIYLAHIERIAQADGPGADIAKSVKRADLADRALHPSPRADGWLPPYTLGLQILGVGPPRGTPTARRDGRSASARMTSEDDPATPTTQSEVPVQRLGSALRGLAAELVDERRKVAQLRQEIADLKARLKALEPPRPGPRDPAGPPTNDT